MNKIKTQLDDFEYKEQLTSEKLNSYGRCLKNEVIFELNQIIEKTLPLLLDNVTALTTAVNTLLQQSGNNNTIATPQLAVALLLSESCGIVLDSPYASESILIGWDDWETYMNPDADLEFRKTKSYKTTTQSSISKSTSVRGRDRVLENLKEYSIQYTQGSDPNVQIVPVLYSINEHVAQPTGYNLTYDVDHVVYDSNGEPVVNTSINPVSGLISTSLDLTWNHGIVAINSEPDDQYGGRAVANKDTNTAYIGNVPTLWEVFNGYADEFKNRMNAPGEPSTCWFTGTVPDNYPPTELTFYAFPVNPDLYDAKSLGSIDALESVRQRWLNKGIEILDAGTYKYTCNFRYGSSEHSQLSFSTWGHPVNPSKINNFDYTQVTTYNPNGSIDLGSQLWNNPKNNPGYFVINPKIDDLLAGIFFVLPGQNHDTQSFTCTDWNDFMLNPDTYINKYLDKKTYPGPDDTKNERDKVCNIARELYYSSNSECPWLGSDITKDEICWYGYSHQSGQTLYGPNNKSLYEFTNEVHLVRFYESLVENGLTGDTLKNTFLQQAVGPTWNEKQLTQNMSTGVWTVTGSTNYTGKFGSSDFDSGYPERMTYKSENRDLDGRYVYTTHTVTYQEILDYVNVTRTMYDCVSRIYVNQYYGPFKSSNGVTYHEDPRYSYGGPLADFAGLGWDMKLNLKQGDILVFLQNFHSDSILLSVRLQDAIESYVINTYPGSTQGYWTSWNESGLMATVAQIMNTSQMVSVAYGIISTYDENKIQSGPVTPENKLAYSWNQEKVYDKLCYIKVPYEDMCSVPNINIDSLGYKYYGPSDYSNPNGENVTEIEYTYESDPKLPTNADASSNDYQYGKIYKYSGDNQYYIKSGNTHNDWTLLSKASLLRKELIGTFKQRWEADTLDLILNNPLSRRLYKRYGGRDYQTTAYRINAGGLNIIKIGLTPYRLSYM